jgi:hypothetical protein
LLSLLLLFEEEEEAIMRLNDEFERESTKFCAMSGITAAAILLVGRGGKEEKSQLFCVE